ncbi:hypothetical protein [Luteimonas sp. SDU101]|uniref:hypothetical protein n=1 Tax=Luteimonas sp. SDU101 TaxID=3422593 RepID=UPI003EBAF69A
MATKPKKATKSAKATKRPGPAAGRKQVSAADLPKKPIEECINVARPIHEMYAGQPATWDELATAAGLGARSNNTKYAIWSAQAYDLLIKSGDKYSLSETARKILAPNYPEERTEGIVKAITVPTVFSKFYSEYNGKLLPQDDFLLNILENRYDVPRERAEEAKDVILANARFAGIMSEHGDGKRLIRLDSAPKSSANALLSPSADPMIGEVENSQDISTGKALGSANVCFYITPIGDDGSEVRKHADLLLKHLIEPAFSEFEVKVIRADKIEKSGLITQQIFEHLAFSKYCVADLSFGNPNAFYELGIRHMTKLPTIQIIRRGDKIPFDVSQGRTISIDMSDIYTIIEKVESARRELVEHIRSYSGGDKGRSDDNPVAIYMPNLNVRLSGSG